MTVAEFWSEQYRVVVEEKKTIGDKLRETLDENKKLRQQNDDLKDSSLAYAAIKNMETEKNDLQTRLNNLRASNEAIRSIHSRMSRSLSSSMHQAQELKMQLEAEKKENESLHNVIDSFIDKCKELEAKVKGYEDALKDGKERLDKSIADRSELQADRDIWFRKNGEKQAEIEELKKDNAALISTIDKCKDQEQKIKNLNGNIEYFMHSRDKWRDRAKHAEKELEEIKSEFKQSYADGYSDGNEEGQNELWEMLQMVKDMQPNEFDVECECLGDVIDMDLEDFKEAYAKWEAEQKKKQHVEYMRDYLKSYCKGRLCTNCPLHNASEPVTSCLFSRMTGEEVEKRYRKVIENDGKKITAPVSAWLPQPWECSIEAKVEINEDILKVVCGIKDDKK